MAPELKQALSAMENRFYRYFDAPLKITEAKLNERQDGPLQIAEPDFCRRLDAFDLDLSQRLRNQARYLFSRLVCRPRTFGSRRRRCRPRVRQTPGNSGTTHRGSSSAATMAARKLA